jgi:hypothetical protein
MTLSPVYSSNKRIREPVVAKYKYINPNPTAELTQKNQSITIEPQTRIDLMIEYATAGAHCKKRMMILILCCLFCYLNIQRPLAIAVIIHL